MSSKARLDAICAFRDGLDHEAREILREQFPGMTLDAAVAAHLDLQAKIRPVSGVRRRGLLKGVGAAALLHPFLGSGMMSGRARAAAPSVDNLLVVTWPCGLEKPWEPPVGPLTSPGQVDVQSTLDKPIMEPLAPYFDRMLLATGMASANDSGNLTLDHGFSTFGMWTGNTPRGTSNGSPSEQRGPSFEQLIAKKISAELSFRSVHVGVFAYGAHPTVSSPYVHYADAAQPITAQNDTLVTYSALMNLVGDPSLSDASLNALKLKKRSVLDYITGRIAGVKARLDSDGQRKLDAHLEHVRALEITLANRGTGSCQLPAAPKKREEILGMPFDPVDYNKGGITTTEQIDFENHVRDQVNTVGLAFKCGLTKVATLQLASTDCRLTGKGMDVPTHYAAHFGNHDQRMHSTIYWTSELRDVLDTMAAYDMGNGQSMLDTTLVVLASEMGVPEHGGQPPFIIIGGQSGFFKKGQHVKFIDSPRPNRLLLTLLKAYGIDMPAYGDTTGNVTGLLTEIMA